MCTYFLVLEAYSLEQSIQGSENDIDPNKIACKDERPTKK